MSKTLKIDESEALRLYPTASKEIQSIFESTFGKEFFKPKVITEIVFDEETLAEHLGIDGDELFIFDKNSKDKHERFINACNILPKVAEIYNEGKILNWNNTSEYKYLAYLNFYGGSAGVSFDGWGDYLGTSAGFYYKNNDLSKASYNNFKKYFEDYWGYKAV